jgi:hypothetical protein
MSKLHSPIRNCLGLLCLVLGSSLPISVTAHEAPKSFAVFTTSFNSSGLEARGGVNGTVFFVSPTRAITANHVVNRSSFKPLPGFEHVKVWLVHEGYAPIELAPENLESDPARDVTVINLPDTKKVEARFVFKMGTPGGTDENVVSEGFIANSAGPILVRQGADLAIVAVPHLSRLFMQGKILRQVRVELKASDIDLKSSPEYELSYTPIVGISGGPVVAHGQVIAMNSFADPSTRRQTWALDLSQGLGLKR